MLIDSHVALWWLANDDRLGVSCRSVVQTASEVYFSPVTPWELGIKKALGKIDFPDGLPEALVGAGFVELPIRSVHTELAATLPHHHRDPFDRLLVAQALLESLQLVTADVSIEPYEVTVLDPRR